MKIIFKPDAALPVRFLIVLAFATLTGVTLAASEGEHREHEAHEHGRGTLDIVAEGEELVVEFRIPAAHVVGFEHAPRDDAEREAVRKAAETFRNPASVLVLPAEAECEVEEAEAGIASMDVGEHEGDHGDEGEGHGHDGDEHAKEAHDEEEGEDHDHEKEDYEDHDHAEAEHEEHDEHSADSDGEAHSELRTTYHFHCHAPERLVRIDVRVFEHLHDAEEIDVRMITATAQTAMELHPGETVVELSP